MRKLRLREGNTLVRLVDDRMGWVATPIHEVTLLNCLLEHVV